LGLKQGAIVLDAGAGSGHVACHRAEKGLTIKAIDIVDSHFKQGREYIKWVTTLRTGSVDFYSCNRI
jgi:ubiquinone/menaquinone biosynthesis C-methylase UbiE